MNFRTQRPTIAQQLMNYAVHSEAAAAYIQEHLPPDASIPQQEVVLEAVVALLKAAR